MIFKVYGLDVWGNAKDGYEVNDRYSIGTIDLPKEFDNARLIEELLAEDLLIKNSVKKYLKHIEIDDSNYPQTIFVDCKGKPLFHLESVGE